MVRLLVIEDFPPLAKGLLRTLRRAGYGVQMAASRAEAQHVSGSFDGAIIDLELPDGLGTEVAADLRRDGLAEQLIFYTACRNPTLLAAAAELGTVVDKAAGVELLLTVLERRFPDRTRQRVAIGDPRGSTSTGPRMQSLRSGTRRIDPIKPNR